ncbi:MAG TPA: hypothetical protein VMZ25_03940 [Terriglobales bacterium]|nr:hypothetical protein [Terriglobales bacterium]
MADQLYLNLWFPSFAESEILPRLLSVLKHFPFSVQRPGVAYISVHALSWQEPELLEQTFDYGTDPELALEMAKDFVHSDNAYEVEAYWDLHIPEQQGDLDETWVLRPQPVKFIAFGTEFDEGTHQQDGHVQVDFGLDTPFLYEDADFTPEVAVRVKSNVQKLVAFIHAVEENCGITGRLLWSEGEGSLAQKLIAKLQKVQ